MVRLLALGVLVAVCVAAEAVAQTPSDPGESISSVGFAIRLLDADGNVMTAEESEPLLRAWLGEAVENPGRYLDPNGPEGQTGAGVVFRNYVAEHPCLTPLVFQKEGQLSFRCSSDFSVEVRENGDVIDDAVTPRAQQE